jgi:multidrug efflux pump subunit AcrA (membrane-fusion protein)
LAARTLQLENAKLNLEAARSGLKQAQLQLQRTVLKAPFPATVVMEQVDVGQVVGVQSQICKLVGNQKLRLELAVPVNALPRIQVAGQNKKGSRVEITQALDASQALISRGEVTHIVGEMDRQTRRARVIVSIPQKPLGGGDLSILPGAFVTAVIYGREEPDIYAIPRKTVSDGNRIWTVASDTTLQSKRIHVLWSSGDSVYGRLDMPEIRLMTTLLPAPVDGIKVQLVN